MEGLSNKQLQILAFPKTKYEALICDGAVRSGKTSIMTLAFVIWAMNEFNQRNFAICGKTVQSAVRNVITPLLAVRYLQKNKYSLSWSFSNHLLTVTRGKKTNYFYVFGGKDEGSAALIQGITLAGTFLDEVALMPRSFVEQALARCSVEGARFWFNCNPEAPSHWFYQEWILHAEEKNALHLHFLMEDNPSLSPEVLERYYSLYSGVFYDRYIKGEWVRAEGLIYPMFRRDKHVIDSFPDNGEYYISIDYGTYNPFSAGLWLVTSEGIAYREKEYYYSGRKNALPKTDEEYYADLENFAGDKYIERIIIDPSASSFITCIKRHGRFRVHHANNDVLEGIRNVATALNTGRLKFSSSCEDTIREFGSYSWDEKGESDKPIKENDHAMDDIRYFVNTVLRKRLHRS